MERDEPSGAGGAPTPMTLREQATAPAEPAIATATVDVLLQPQRRRVTDPIPVRPAAPPPAEGYAGVSLVAENTVPRVDPRCSHLGNGVCCPEEITAGFYLCMYCSRLLWPPMPGTCVIAPWEPVGQSW